MRQVLMEGISFSLRMIFARASTPTSWPCRISRSLRSFCSGKGHLVRSYIQGDWKERVYNYKLILWSPNKIVWNWMVRPNQVLRATFWSITGTRYCFNFAVRSTHSPLSGLLQSNTFEYSRIYLPATWPHSLETSLCNLWVFKYCVIVMYLECGSSEIFLRVESQGARGAVAIKAGWGRCFGCRCQAQDQDGSLEFQRHPASHAQSGNRRRLVMSVGKLKPFLLLISYVIGIQASVADCLSKTPKRRKKLHREKNVRAVWLQPSRKREWARADARAPFIVGERGQWHGRRQARCMHSRPGEECREGKNNFL